MVIQLYVAIKLIELYMFKNEFYCINLYSKNLTKIFLGGALNFRSIQGCQGKLTTMKSSPCFLPFLSLCTFFLGSHSLWWLQTHSPHWWLQILYLLSSNSKYLLVIQNYHVLNLHSGRVSFQNCTFPYVSYVLHLITLFSGHFYWTSLSLKSMLISH